MGGDHKCPVCEATFTRPQHVARHMRSHTGDRPYKCQYCGDQFARSDLLSRHVNKCHANEKPLPSTGVRRKGSASASRATTSKQVCDQCVQANTSCDGSNPCSKCVQRKYRCTFVKFHRQTAPVGPGHSTRSGPETSGPPSPMTASSPLSRAPMYHQQQPEEDFILGPSPTVVPTMADTLYGAAPFTFPPLYPTNDLSGDNTDYVGKYRAHAELFGSARSAMSTAGASSSSGLSPTLYDPRPPSSWLGWGQQDPTDAYQHHQQQQSVHPSSSLSPSSMNDKDMQAELARHHQHQPQRSNMNPNHYLNVSIPYSSNPSNYNLLSDPNNGNTIGPQSTEIIDVYGSDSASVSSCSVPSSAASSFVHLPLANTAVDDISTRKESFGGGYDNNALLIPEPGPTSSISPSSSHPDHRQNPTFQPKQASFPTHDQNTFSSNRHHHHHHQHQHQPHPHSHPHHLQQQIVPDLARPEFSSAFGLLSLDDPNVIAGIATDGTPFFDDPNQAHNQARSTTSGPTTSDVVQLGGADMDTPMPMSRDSAQLQLPSVEASQRFPMPTSSSLSAAGVAMENGNTPSRERDSKELKEFWKQYMRIPLSGSGMFSLAGGSEGVTPSGNKATNTPGYRRPRVASLPSVKTPILEGGNTTHLNIGHSNATHQNSSTSIPSNVDAGDGQGPTASAACMRRASLREMPAVMGDNTEDLRSYEAAVMARKPSTMLNLNARRSTRGRGRDRGTGGKFKDEGSASESSGNSPHAMGGGDTTDYSSSSSLANAFGAGQRLVSHSRDQTVLSAPGGVPLQFSGRNSIKEEESSSPSLSSRASSLSASLEGDLEPEVVGDDSQSDLDSLRVASPLIGNMGRPSFKRLPSQTLGPDNTKRPFYGFGEEEDRFVSGWGVVDEKMAGCGGGGGENNSSSIAERRSRKRRMSEPSTSLTTGFHRGEQGKYEKSSRVDVSAAQSVDEAMI